MDPIVKPKRSPKRALSIITFWFLALMASLFLLYPGFGGYEQIQSARYTLFLLLCGGYAALMLLAMGELVLVGGAKFQSPLKWRKSISWVQKLLLVYLLLTWLSAFCSPLWPQTLVGISRYEGTLTTTIYVVCFLLVSHYGCADKQLLAIFAGALTLFCLLVQLQLLGLNPLRLYPEGLTYFHANIEYSGAYLGTIGNTDLVVAFLCIAIPLLWLTLLRGHDRCRWWLALPLALALAVLVQMNVQAGLVGVFGGALLTLPAVLPTSNKARTGTALGVAALILAALALLLFCRDAKGGARSDRRKGQQDRYCLRHHRPAGRPPAGRVRQGSGGLLHRPV